MLKNYIIISWRILWKGQPVSFINVFGLVIGMVSCLLIWQYVGFELSYDSFHSNAGKIHRVTSLYDNGGNPSQSALSTFNIGHTLKKSFPEVEKFTRMHAYSQGQFSCAMMYKGGVGAVKVFNEANLFYADASFFSIFSFPLLQGDPLEVLKGHYSAVISEATAAKYFGNEDPLGKVLTLHSSSKNADYIVTGVMKDIPENSHIRPEVLLSIQSLQGFENDGGAVEGESDRADFYTYILLQGSIKPDDFAKKLDLFNRKKPKAPDGLVSFKIQAIEDIHLMSDVLYGPSSPGSAEIVYFLIALAFFIMALAWINYLNLSTVRFLERIKEFGLRKISGANRYEFVKQCFIETLLVLLISTIAALVVRHLIVSVGAVKAYLFGSGFLMVTGISWPVVTVFVCFGILIGVYQALFLSSFLSSFKLTSVLKGRFSGTAKGSWLRKSLVVFQFTISIILITGILAVHGQFKYMLNQGLGIDLGQKIVVKTPSNVDSTYITKLASFKNELKGIANIDKVSISSIVPGIRHDWYAEVRKQHERKEAYKDLAVYVLDADFFDIYGLKIIAGRGFLEGDQPGKRFGSKLENVIINEKAVKELGFQSYQGAINEMIYWGDTKCRIIGVVKDFHQRSLRHAIQPAIFTVNNRDSIFYSINLNNHTPGPAGAERVLASTLPLIRQNWDRFFPDNPFDYFLLKDAFDNQYKPDFQLAGTLGLFSVLATFIACLGLFGLSAFTTSQRIREIGVRKVLGASPVDIVRLVSGDFLLLITFAGIFAIPVAYIGVRHWLTYYAYNMDISWWILVLPLVTVAFTALLTVSFHTIKASLYNPVDALKYE